MFWKHSKHLKATKPSANKMEVWKYVMTVLQRWIIPMQACLVGVLWYPSWHLQRYDPWELTQSPLIQGLLEHSSTSEGTNTNMFSKINHQTFCGTVVQYHQCPTDGSKDHLEPFFLHQSLTSHIRLYSYLVYRVFSEQVEHDASNTRVTGSNPIRMKCTA